MVRVTFSSPAAYPLAEKDRGRAPSASSRGRGARRCLLSSGRRSGFAHRPVLEALAPLLAAFALLLHPFSLAHHALPAALLAVGGAIDRVCRPDVALGAKLLGPLLLDRGLALEVFAPLLAVLAVALAALAGALEVLRAAFRPLGATGARRRRNQQENRNHSTEQGLHGRFPPSPIGPGKRPSSNSDSAF